MRIEDFKRWQWCIVGLLVGASLAFIRLSMLPREPKTPGNFFGQVGLERVAPNVFESDLLHERDPVTRREVYAVQNITIHPPADMPIPGERSEYAEYLSYDVLLVRRDNHKLADPMPRQMIMALAAPKSPSSPATTQATAAKQRAVAARHESLAGDLTGLSLRDYLEKLKVAIPKKYPKADPITYKVAWAEAPKAAYTIFMTGGFVVIGIIWPTVIHFLVIAGYGRPRTADEKEIDLARYKAKNAAAKAKPGVTQDQMDELDRLEAELEAKLREGATEGPTDAPAAKPVTAPAIPVLSAGPMEAPKPTPEQARPRKGYGADQGDFYPTEVHGKKSS